jgi:hypothetical protein
MFMRFLWGYGVGHVYAHHTTKLPDTCDVTLQEADEESCGEGPEIGSGHQDDGTDGESEGSIFEDTESDDH